MCVLLETGMSSLEQARAQVLCMEQWRSQKLQLEEGQLKVPGAEKHGLSELERPSR